MWCSKKKASHELVFEVASRCECFTKGDEVQKSVKSECWFEFRKDGVHALLCRVGQSPMWGYAQILQVELEPRQSRHRPCNLRCNEWPSPALFIVVGRETCIGGIGPKSAVALGKHLVYPDSWRLSWWEVPFREEESRKKSETPGSFMGNPMNEMLSASKKVWTYDLQWFESGVVAYTELMTARSGVTACAESWCILSSLMRKILHSTETWMLSFHILKLIWKENRLGPGMDSDCAHRDSSSFLRSSLRPWLQGNEQISCYQVSCFLPSRIAGIVWSLLRMTWSNERDSNTLSCLISLMPLFAVNLQQLL